MRVTYAPDYVVPLPAGHPFPMPKFSALRRILLDEGLVRASDIVVPEVVPWDDLRLVHTEAYLRGFGTGTLTAAEVRRLGVPWSRRLVRRSRLAVAGTIAASRMALEDGLAANLAGGTHHACPDHGEGFCALNDVAVAIRVLRREGRLGRALIIDLDVHQGNGNAMVFGAAGANDAEVYTFSMHGERNFPLRKPPSTRDVGLPDGCEDATYLRTLRRHLPEVLDDARADLVFYLAGVDPIAGDRYGRLALTRVGLAERERTVLEAVHRRNLPLVLLLSGGYAPTPEMTADLHAVVHREAAHIYRGRTTKNA